MRTELAAPSTPFQVGALCLSQVLNFGARGLLCCCNKNYHNETRSRASHGKSGLSFKLYILKKASVPKGVIGCFIALRERRGGPKKYPRENAHLSGFSGSSNINHRLILSASASSALASPWIHRDTIHTLLPTNVEPLHRSILCLVTSVDL